MNQSKYISHPVDSKGMVSYSTEEHAVWSELYERQIQIVQNRGCDEYIQGIKDLELSPNRIPQLPEINETLSSLTGWKVEPVPALIDSQRFFELLSQKKFPAATFIRRREELNYLQEPDIFHELFGHCPLLTHPVYADFMHTYGQIGLHANDEDREMLATLYWFTVEFGLIETPKGLRIYGGGILSSIGETVYALESEIPVRKALNPIEAFRTPYRIDIFQPIYFIIKNFDQLYHLVQEDLIALIQEARRLGMFLPSFPRSSYDLL